MAETMVKAAFGAERPKHPNATCLLLVDSERAVSTTPRHHLKAAGWEDEGGDGTHWHLMVEMMEAWFLADPEALERLFATPGSLLA